MNVGAVTPLLLWFLSANDIPSAVLENSLRVIESFLVRRAACGYGGKSYGAFFGGLIEKLTAAPVDKVDNTLRSHLADQTARATLWPDDAELCARFVSAPLYQWLTRGRLRMLLTGIEGQLRTGKAETQKVPDKLHIEHIMPQKWRTNWPLPDDGDHDARENLIHTIGNLTLVNGQLNSSLSNAAWNSKRETLADHSTLFLNKHLVREGPAVWDENAIGERSKLLYEIAAKVWPHYGDIEA